MSQFNYVGTSRGQMSNAYIVRCATCATKDIYECLGRAERTWAERHLRDRGWSKAKHGWRCPTCKGGTAAQTPQEATNG